MHDRIAFTISAVCMTGKPFSGLGEGMTSKHLLGNAVCTTGISVRHTSAVCMMGEPLLEMPYA